VHKLTTGGEMEMELIIYYLKKKRGKKIIKKKNLVRLGNIITRFFFFFFHFLKKIQNVVVKTFPKKLANLVEFILEKYIYSKTFP
jgi:hypothetical protein